MSRHVPIGLHQLADDTRSRPDCHRPVGRALRLEDARLPGGQVIEVG
jgi:hypothetical protein